MKTQNKQIIRNILVAVIILSVIPACTLSERNTNSSSAQTERVVHEKSDEEIYEEKRKEAVGTTIDIYNQILEDD